MVCLWMDYAANHGKPSAFCNGKGRGMRRNGGRDDLPAANDSAAWLYHPDRNSIEKDV